MKRITDCSAWPLLEAHYQQLRGISIRQLFSESPRRFADFSFDSSGLFVDYSKNWMTAETIALLCALARDRELPQAITTLFSSEKHFVFRLPSHAQLPEVQEEFEKISRIADQLEKKELRGYSGKPIDTIIHVGMGGSGLGPAFYYQAISHAHKNATCHFLTEFDFFAVQSVLALCNPETTIAVIVSKTFTTQETLTIYESIKQWLCDAAGNAQKAQAHFYAVTAGYNHAIAAGFLQTHILKIWDWVGGRFSIWSAVSFSVILALGVDNFKRFLSGAHQMDLHFQQTPLQNNAPVIMALLAIWYNNFFHAHAKAIIPYSSRLTALPIYLQQLHMESLGKSVTTTGEKIQYATGRIIMGDTGPRSQHSFHQLLMQGSLMIPVDFILPLRDAQFNESANNYDIKRAAYCLSQSQTLMQGYETPNTMQAISGDRPSTTIIMDCLTPETLGALLALYEHKVFVKSIMWDINAFDQWGVERGKQIAKELITCLSENKKCDSADSSTAGLLERISRRLLEI